MGTTYEDVFFYLDLTKDVLKKKDLIKALKLYIQEKNKINIKGHYAILIFQEEGNPIFIKDKKDSEIISKAIEEIKIAITTRTSEGDNVIIAGVGNCCGIGD